MEQKDYYQELGVEKSATQQEIKEAYRNMALRYHPDRNADSQVSADRMKGLNEAYAVLSDPVKRKEYDLLREQVGASAQERFRQTYSDQEIFRGSDVQQIFEEVARSFGLRGFDEIFKDINSSGRGGFHFQRQGFKGGGFVFHGRLGHAGRRYGRRHGMGLGSRQQEGLGPAGFNSLRFDPVHLIGRVRRYLAAMRPTKDGGHEHDTIFLTPELAQSGGPYAYMASHNKKKLVVKIPPNVRSGQMIRLAGMGKGGQNGGRSGDLYLQVRIKTPFIDKLKTGLTRLIGRA